jgi:5-methylcytosine-specific restriction endonuclease McrA
VLAAKLINLADTRGRRAPISKAVRKRIIAAHGGRCFYCGGESDRMEIDHVIPVSRGGATTENNLVPACKPCNLKKLSQTYEEWQTRKGRRG